ncbi:type II secretion system minor pseudopilin GspI [Aquipseudomonas ullengensis]|uniref:Type II secretion system protein I n=1 Tax=Aquipseudomonas ullengensis TaxID=2759166 RepID=A0A7W4LL92_9GAMM|nr:type II secretion system minor pseudopilin GspI [Pseudomonas ullengensis]MBB2495037.1 type II secretion system minor pseudopilin GspI [Pseudomonas ullengensis]
MMRSRGFTLLEVLVALGIFALVAASVLVASSRALQTAARLEDKTFALWLADNHLQDMQLAEIPPSEGREAGEDTYAGRRWLWQSKVEATSEPDMRRVTVWVAVRPDSGLRGNIEDQALVSLSGFVGVEP